MSDIIWNWQVRLIHWSLAVAIILNIYVFEDGDRIHEWIGYAAAGFVVIRFVIGFVGKAPAQFSSFPVSFREIKIFIKNLISNRKVDYPGHNPLASLTYFAMWGLVIALGLTGWMMSLDRYWGEEWLKEFHTLISDSLQILILIHLLGIVLDSIKFRRKTWMKMINGRNGNIKKS